MIEIPCMFGGPTHCYPDDWVFNEFRDPRADRRFIPLHYVFLDTDYMEVYRSGSFLCEDEALDYFTELAKQWPNVRYIGCRYPGSEKYTLEPWIYVAETDTVHPYVKVKQ